MKTIFISILFLIVFFTARSQELHPLLGSLGEQMELKEFKKLTGLKCYQSTSMSVASRKAEISFYLDEEKAIEQVEIRPTYLEKNQYTENPLLGISTHMDFETCYSHLEKLEGTSKFSSKSYDRSITFYYSPVSANGRFYVHINLARDENKILNVDRITIRKAE